MKQNSPFSDLFSILEQINARPKPFEFDTVSELWTNEYTSKQMLACHLNENIDVSSRKMSFINQSVDWLINKFGMGAGTNIADFGCGPGLYTSRLAKTGAAVTGIDFSPRSIEYARSQAENNGQTIHYVCQNYLEFETDQKFDLILMIYDDFCVLSPANRWILLNKFHSLLNPGGRMILDVVSISGFDHYKETANYTFHPSNGFWQADPYYEFQNSFKYEKEKVSVEKYTIIGSKSSKTIYTWLQYYSVESLKAEFNGANLGIQEVFADVAGRPYDPDADEFAVVAGLI